MLSPRQELLLGKVVDLFAEAGQPVGSKALASDEEIAYGPSTIRNELAVLEEQGLLAHPHTSAGRVPTDAGYRYFVDEILPQRRSTAIEPRVVELTLARREVDEAMRVTTETLSQVTNLLAIVSAPPIATTTIRHVEVLALQPQVLMVVIITSTGGVSKRIFAFEEPVDPGLAEWAAAYLNEQLVGMGLGARMLHSRLEDPTLPPKEGAFITRLKPAFTELAETAEETLYVDGTARLLSEYRFQDLPQLNAVMEMLERRVTLLGVLSDALAERGLYVRIGHGERHAGAPGPLAGRRQLRPAVAQPRHRLGDRADAHGLRRRHPLRPRRRPPALALRRRRLHATDGARLLRDPRRRARRRRRPDQEGLPQARARAAPGRQRPRPGRGGEVQGGRGRLRGALGPRAPAPLRRLRRGGAARPRLRARHGQLRLGLRPLLGDLRPGRLRGGLRRRRRPAAAAAAGSRAATS